MAPKNKKITSHRKLLLDLQAIIDAGREAALKTIGQIRTETYWKLGRRLSNTKEFTQEGTGHDSSGSPAKSPANSDLIQTLGEALHLDPSLLYRSLQFYRTYPKGLPKEVTAAQLPWSAHEALLPLKDPKEREYYLKQAVAQGWSRNRLRQAIKADLYQDQKGGKGRKTKTKLKRPTTGLHTYVAEVEKVVDGDTLIARIDLGFDVWKSQRIRFRGIDTDPADTPKGRKATAYVRKQLEKPPFIVLKTYQVDMYYRYVADIFYLPGVSTKEKVFTEGKFLNEELVKEGLAELVF